VVATAAGAEAETCRHAAHGMTVSGRPRHRRPGGASVPVVSPALVARLARIGISVLAFRYVFGQNAFDPEIPIFIFIFIFLVALGSDYTIFLMSAVRDEAAKRGLHDGALRWPSTSTPR